MTDSHAGKTMRLLAAILLLTLSAGCSLTPHQVENPTPQQNRAVVFDIDGTLTSKIHAIRTAREGAPQAVQAFADGGFHIIYLSARTPLLQFHIPHWMDQHGFPPGSIHVTESREDRRDHKGFKQRVLEAYRARGWTFVAAYGDSSTDFAAYEAAGITPERIFALQRRGESNCEPGTWSGCHESWPEQMGIINGLIQKAPR
jgi:hypothetical protein